VHSAVRKTSLQLLGSPRLWPASTGPALVLSPLDAALLAVLALSGAQPRQGLTALLWPGSAPERAANSLRQRAYRLKQNAGMTVVDGSHTRALSAGVAHDLAQFAQRVAQDAGHGSEPLLGSLDFPDHDELTAWLASHRAALAQTRSRVLEETAQLHAGKGQLSLALQFAQAWVLHEPGSERSHRLLMQLLYRSGDRAGALAAFQRCAQELRRTLDTAPSAETRELLQQIVLEKLAVLPSDARGAMPLALLVPTVHDTSSTGWVWVLTTRSTADLARSETAPRIVLPTLTAQGLIEWLAAVAACGEGPGASKDLGNA
jgi:DNA-binding SARP family transcriptional activator